MIHQRYRQTDRQTDGQTTCDSRTSLCTVHRAVKQFEMPVRVKSFEVSEKHRVEECEMPQSPFQGEDAGNPPDSVEVELADINRRCHLSSTSASYVFLSEPPVEVLTCCMHDTSS